jgi:hypothetical protein
LRDELIHIGQKNDTARGKRYLTLETLERQVALEQVFVVPGSERRDREGNLVSLRVTSERYVESDAAVIQRVLGREAAGKQNVLVLNDEAHHAYRLRKDATEDEDMFEEDETEEEEQFFEEATVWVEGLDRINTRCGINFCVDLSATPYFLGRVGQDTNFAAAPNRPKSVSSYDVRPVWPTFRPSPTPFQAVDLDLQTRREQRQEIHLPRRCPHLCPAGRRTSQKPTQQNDSAGRPPI